MQQQTQIVIDFEDIFSPYTEDAEIQLPLALNQSSQTAPPFITTHSQPILLSPRHITHTFTSTSFTNSIENKKHPPNFQLNLTNNSNVLSSLLDRSTIVRRKQSTLSKKNQMLNRLAAAHQSDSPCHKFQKQSGKHQKCLKSQIIQNRTDKTRNINKDSLPCRSQPSFIPSAQDQSDAFQRLYLDSKSAILKNKYSPSAPHKIKQKKRCLSTSQSRFLTRYIPFYSRLESELNSSFERKKLLEQGLIGNKYQQPQFQPKLTSKKYHHIKSRYLKQNLNHSLLNSNHQDSQINKFSSTFHKSAELIAEVEHHFFRKMQCIFVDSASQHITITENVIALLTEVEFQLLHNFINYLEENPIPSNHFSYYLHSYYEVLLSYPEPLYSRKAPIENPLDPNQAQVLNAAKITNQKIAIQIQNPSIAASNVAIPKNEKNQILRRIPHIYSGIHLTHQQF